MSILLICIQCQRGEKWKSGISDSETGSELNEEPGHKLLPNFFTYRWENAERKKEWDLAQWQSRLWRPVPGGSQTSPVCLRLPLLSALLMSPSSEPSFYIRLLECWVFLSLSFLLLWPLLLGSLTSPWVLSLQVDLGKISSARGGQSGRWACRANRIGIPFLTRTTRGDGQEGEEEEQVEFAASSQIGRYGKRQWTRKERELMEVAGEQLAGAPRRASLTSCCRAPLLPLPFACPPFSPVERTSSWDGKRRSFWWSSRAGDLSSVQRSQHRRSTLFQWPGTSLWVEEDAVSRQGFSQLLKHLFVAFPFSSSQSGNE